jgi:hypothetical protein
MPLRGGMQRYTARRGVLAVWRATAKLLAPSEREGAMKSSDSSGLQQGEVVAALESVRAFESSLATLAAKVADLERRLGAAEERLEKIAESIGEQD